MQCLQLCLASTFWPPLTRGNTSETIIGGHRVDEVDVYHTNRLMLTLDAKFITTHQSEYVCWLSSSVVSACVLCCAMIRGCRGKRDGETIDENEFVNACCPRKFNLHN